MKNNLCCNSGLLIIHIKLFTYVKKFNNAEQKELRNDFVIFFSNSPEYLWYTSQVVNLPSICIFYLNHQNPILLKAVIVADDVRVVQHGQDGNLRTEKTIIFMFVGSLEEKNMSPLQHCVLDQTIYIKEKMFFDKRDNSCLY